MTRFLPYILFAAVAVFLAVFGPSLEEVRNVMAFMQ